MTIKTTSNKNLFGLHSGEKKKIRLNLKAIGNNPYKFIETITHETEHAYQHKEIQKILAKSRNLWTPEERTLIAHYNISKRVNRDRQRYYNAHKKLIDKFEKSKFNNAEERDAAISKLSPKEQEIIYKNDNNIVEYYNAGFEKDARKVGAEYAKGYKTLSGFDKRGTTGTQQKSNEIIPQRNVGTNTGNSSSYGRLRANRGRSSRFESEDTEAQFSFEESRYRDESDEQAFKSFLQNVEF